MDLVTGPYRTTAASGDAAGALALNPDRWNSNATLLFIESPAGALLSLSAPSSAVLAALSRIYACATIGIHRRRVLPSPVSLDIGQHGVP